MSGGSPEKENSPEGIKGPAVRYKGEVVCSTTHHAAAEILREHYKDDARSFDKDLEVGWTTTKGRFVSRREAEEIKIRNGEILPEDLMMDDEFYPGSLKP